MKQYRKSIKRSMIRINPDPSQQTEKKVLKFITKNKVERYTKQRIYLKIQDREVNQKNISLDILLNIFLLVSVCLQFKRMKADEVSSSLKNQIDDHPEYCPPKKYPIYLNIYNFNSCFNSFCSCCGLGVYHTGIESQYEYMYFGFDGDQTGVGYLQPRTAAYEFKEHMPVGFTEYSHYQIDQHMLQPLRMEFTGTYTVYHQRNRYDLLNNNCNHFSRRFAQMLRTSYPVPNYVFTITDFFNMCRCCLPKCILNGRLDWFSHGEKENYASLEESMHVSFKHDAHK